MSRIALIPLLLFFSNVIQAQSYLNQLEIPDTIAGTTFNLTVTQSFKEFESGIQIPVRGYNQSYLGPTLIFNKGDQVQIIAENTTSDLTTIHWHGMQVPAAVDGGPHTIILPGATWSPSFDVIDKAATMWYHSHLHQRSKVQVNEGLAGMIIIRDAQDYGLPKTYGVDDIPLIIQDKTFNAQDSIDNNAVLGEDVLVNGTLWPQDTLPAQVVRLRLLNGSIKRTYNLGLSTGDDFWVIASDGGYLQAPVQTDRLRLSSGERYEILIDLGSFTTGDSIFLMNYASEMPYGVEGGIPGIDTYPSPLNGVDTAMMKIVVGAPTPSPVTQIPVSLDTNQDIPVLSEAQKFRTQAFTGKPNPDGSTLWTINDLAFSMQRIDDTIASGSTEVWTIHNQTHISHPFHIHSGHFYVLDRDSVPPTPIEAGPKDVVMVEGDEKLRFIMKFPDFSDTARTYMYHCHMLDHEDKAMMAQFLLMDSIYFPTSINEESYSEVVYPNPVTDFIYFEGEPDQASIFDIHGRLIKSALIRERRMDLSNLSEGMYYILLSDKSSGEQKLQSFIKH